MKETATSIMNKNNLLYGEKIILKNTGPDCIDGKGKIMNPVKEKPDEAPMLAVRER